MALASESVVRRAWTYESLRIYLACKMGFFLASSLSYYFTYERLGTNKVFSVIENLASLRLWSGVLFLLAVGAGTTIAWTRSQRARMYCVACFGIEFLFAMAIFATFTWSPLVWTYMLLASFDFFVSRAKMIEG